MQSPGGVACTEGDLSAIPEGPSAQYVFGTSRKPFSTFVPGACIPLLRRDPVFGHDGIEMFRRHGVVYDALIDPVAARVRPKNDPVPTAIRLKSSTIR